MNNKLDFKDILIMSSVTKRSHGLARAIQQHLHEPRFTYLDPKVDALPDRLFNWPDTDLAMIDVSSDKSIIYKWYSAIGRSDFMPPVIFLAHPASYSDAGAFYRAGASNYLELSGIKNSHLPRALAIAAKSMAVHQPATPESSPPESGVDSENPFSLRTIISTERTQPEPSKISESASSKESRADFLNTGVMDILDREELKKKAEEKAKL